MPPPTAKYDLDAIAAAAGFSNRTVRHWIRAGVVPKPVGRGRAARYDERHQLRARVVQHLRASDLSLAQIHARLTGLSEDAAKALLPSAQQTAADGLPLPPPAPTYPSSTWEIVRLVDGLILLVDPARGPGLRRVVQDMYNHYVIKAAPGHVR